MLEAKNLRKVYHNGREPLEVLKGLDLQIEKGRFAAITGPSGAGKSTLLHILGGLDKPSEGAVTFGGEDIYGLGDAALSSLRNKNIGFVFQFYHLLSEFTLWENILMPGLLNDELRFTNYDLRRRAEELLAQVGLIQRKHHFPSQLSGGEQQRSAIVRALINKPQLLLCDEPTGNLDSQAGEEIIALLKKINYAEKMTVVLVTHNLELAKAADRIYHLKDGVLVN